MSDKNEPITKISLVCSKGSLDGIYPSLIMANGARMEGIDVSVFLDRKATLNSSHIPLFRMPSSACKK